MPQKKFTSQRDGRIKGRFLFLLASLLLLMGIAPFFQSYIRTSIITSIFLTATLVSTMYAISPHKKQTATALILGAPMLAFMWSFIYSALELASPGSFHFGGGQTGDTRIPFIYYSFVTLTTLGYGDITPVTDKTQALSILEAILGQMYLIFQVAWLVGRYTFQSTRDTPAND